MFKNDRSKKCNWRRCKARKDFRKNVFEGGDKRVPFPAQEKLIAERVLQQRELHVRVTHRGT